MDEVIIGKPRWLPPQPPRKHVEAVARRSHQQPILREKNMNYIDLIQLQAAHIFGNKAKADIWLNQPKAAFDGSTPLELAHTEAGYECVKAELERVSHGYAC